MPASALLSFTKIPWKAFWRGSLHRALVDRSEFVDFIAVVYYNFMS
jgi:hypothetical protein